MGRGQIDPRLNKRQQLLFGHRPRGERPPAVQRDIRAAQIAEILNVESAPLQEVLDRLQSIDPLRDRPHRRTQLETACELLTEIGRRQGRSGWFRCGSVYEVGYEIDGPSTYYSFQDRERPAQRIELAAVSSQQELATMIIEAGIWDGTESRPRPSL